MLISQRRGGNSYWFHDDALGSTSAITASDETVTSTYKYYAFGDVLTSSGTLANAFKFVGGLGYYSDPDSGLLLLRARYYWPGIARFLTLDPRGCNGNCFVYAANTPVQWIDPTGAKEEREVECVEEGRPGYGLYSKCYRKVTKASAAFTRYTKASEREEHNGVVLGLLKVFLEFDKEDKNCRGQWYFTVVSGLKGYQEPEHQWCQDHGPIPDKDTTKKGYYDLSTVGLAKDIEKFGSWAYSITPELVHRREGIKECPVKDYAKDVRGDFLVHFDTGKTGTQGCIGIEPIGVQHSRADGDLGVRDFRCVMRFLHRCQGINQIELNVQNIPEQ
jgi:RHS repeat-associated protein